MRRQGTHQHWQDQQGKLEERQTAQCHQDRLSQQQKAQSHPGGRCEARRKKDRKSKHARGRPIESQELNAVGLENVAFQGKQARKSDLAVPMNEIAAQTDLRGSQVLTFEHVCYMQQATDNYKEEVQNLELECSKLKQRIEELESQLHDSKQTATTTSSQSTAPDKPRKLYRYIDY